MIDGRSPSRLKTVALAVLMAGALTGWALTTPCNCQTRIMHLYANSLAWCRSEL